MQLETEARAIEAFHRRPRILRLECGVQHYDWGDPEAIPAILGQQNPEGRPFAELWAGAHPDRPSQAIIDGVRVPLDLLMRDAAGEILGRALSNRFNGELPFLVKILAAAKPLSIQVHPNHTQALLGFERENLEGLPRDAAIRNYRDPRQKPELLVALTDFYALRGFRPLAEIEQTLSDTPELGPLAGHKVRDASGLATLYGHIMRLNQPGISALLEPLIRRLETENDQNPFAPDDRAYWILRAHREFSTSGRADRGLLSILLLNLVRLRPGQALFLPAGELHSYLRGVGIEIMANSNNVLRGGLTSKHVDPEALLQVLTFHAGPAEVLEPVTSSEKTWLAEYDTPAAEFALRRLTLNPGQIYPMTKGGMRLALITNGAIDVAAVDSEQLHARQGEALLVPAGLGCRVACTAGAELWLARVPGTRTARR